MTGSEDRYSDEPMCGLAGLLHVGALELGALVSRMTASIRYRGPDACGKWCDPTIGLALGHARLSILDLSEEGHQPMCSASGRFVLSYNGEIYNFSDLRSELETMGAKFRGHSDTEVMLAAFEAWGTEKSVERFVGMFAFVLWDREARVLHLGRDRLGIKPLYYGWVDQAFVFGSELKVFEQVPGFRRAVNRNSLSAFMRYAYVPEPWSIYQDVYKLPPGCLFSTTLEQARTRQGFSPEPEDEQATLRPVRYWSARDIVESGVRSPFTGTGEEAVEQLDRLLRATISLHMVADVPLGAFLSGGIDSSLVVALMQAQSHNPVRTFTVGFRESGYNEAVHARHVAAHLRTDHTELYVTPDQAMAVIPGLPAMYDEPFGDPSQIPTYLVSALARRYVTVALSGDGGDELFAGYNRYFWIRRLWKRLSAVPVPLRAAASVALQSCSPETWGRLYAGFSGLLPSVQNPGDKVQKLAKLVTMTDPDSMYMGMVSLWDEPTKVVVTAAEPRTVLNDRARWARLSDFTMRMMYLDLATYLPDDILTKVDRASMAVGLEARVPLLDHRVVEFAWQLPLSMKIRREGEGKWLLRKVLDRYVPKELIDRPKTGFGVPIDSWLRGPLREWTEGLLDERRLREEGFFHPGPIREKWAEHLSGKRNWQYLLWNVLMFQAWLCAHDRSPAPAVSHH